jgi:hypothetical protein
MESKMEEEFVLTSWQRIGNYEYEHDGHDYTGWHRCVGGRLADGRYPEWNYQTGETRYS